MLPVVFSGIVSFIISNSILSVAVFLAFEILLLEEVLVDDRLVPDENDDPSDIIELGRCTILAFSFNDDENVFRNLGAANKL